MVWELDSDDEIIVAMKQQNATDHEVANRLISEGRTRYNYKTISSRWIRLRNVLAKREDELLDEDLTDWHEGEVGRSSRSGTAGRPHVTNSVTGRTPIGCI